MAHTQTTPCIIFTQCLSSTKVIVLLSMIWVLLSMIFLPLSAFAQDDNYHGGILELNDSTQHHNAILLSTDVHFDIAGLTATVNVIQEFRNNTGKWLEGRYVFSLPENSAVNFMAMHIGDRIIEAQIKEKHEAQKIYQKAKSEGRKAAITLQTRANLFTQKVANLPPEETIKVELRYIQTLDYDLGRFSLRFPIAITPRYTPGTSSKNESPKNNNEAEGYSGSVSSTRELPSENPIAIDTINDDFAGSVASTSRTATSRTSASRISASRTSTYRTTRPKVIPSDNAPHPNARINVQGVLHPGVELNHFDSSSHAINIHAIDNHSWSFELADKSTQKNRDFTLEWQTADHKEPLTAIFHEQMNNSSYIQFMMLPPNISQSKPIIPRELMLIVDTSGSMQGSPIDHAKASAIVALQQLHPEDSFNIIEFNSRYSKFSNTPITATQENINRAILWISQLHANGGTNMQQALYAALSSTPSQALKQVVFVTDGAVSNEQSLFKLIHEQLNDARLFTVGIGSAPNSFFMRKAAKFGRGSFTYINDYSKVKTHMLDLFKKLNSAVVTDIDIQWPAGVNADSYPNKIPDLYLGEPLLIHTKFANTLNDPEAITVTGQIGRETWARTMTIPNSKKHFNTAHSNDRSALASMWARQNIEQRLDSKITGTPEANIKPEVVKLALEHQLLSPYTSFVAVEKIVSKAPGDTIQASTVPSIRPHNQTQNFKFPQTATGLQQHLLFGCLCLFLFAIMRIRWQ